MSTILAIEGSTPVRTRPFPTWPVFGKEEEQALLRTLHSGKWGRLDGDEVAQFERRFADYQQAKQAIAVVNGTVSLRVALLAAGIQAGDEVIVPPYTFLATATAVVEANATPVFADIELDTLNLDLKCVEAAITPRTRAIIPVHFAGLPVAMDGFMALAERHRLTVIEDAAHAHGAEYKGRRVGALGHLGSFSFQSTKNLTSGEGGIILTNDEGLAERCRSIHNCGRIPGGAWYEHHLISGNYRLGEFQGAILNAQLDRFDAQANTREQNGKYLAGRLEQVPGIKAQRRGPDCTRHGYHLFTFRVDPQVLGASRKTFLQALEAEGIPASGGYVMPLYRQPLFGNLAFGPYRGYESRQPELDYRHTSCPNCETICSSQGAWLEQRLLLGTRADIDDIASAFEKVHEQRGRLASLEAAKTA
ncbi:MAG: DegT/DnrJ/EryC1/StrS family aminotransferase [Verrucomicrobia bacterium]|nr:DegT/DnrJ/EryC1/StrS family aminotransferase [Verrucomicrobiota bacterium]